MFVIMINNNEQIIEALDCIHFHYFQASLRKFGIYELGKDLWNNPEDFNYRDDNNTKILILKYLLNVKS